MQNRKDYPENWATEIRPVILARDKMKCVTCGVKQGQRQVQGVHGVWEDIDVDDYFWLQDKGYKTRRVWLCVAHIDHNKSNCDPVNLVTECPSCHAKRDKQQRLLMRIGNLVKPSANKSTL